MAERYWQDDKSLESRNQNLYSSWRKPSRLVKLPFREIQFSFLSLRSSTRDKVLWSDIRRRFYNHLPIIHLVELVFLFSLLMKKSKNKIKSLVNPLRKKTLIRKYQFINESKQSNAELVHHLDEWYTQTLFDKIDALQVDLNNENKQNINEK